MHLLCPVARHRAIHGDVHHAGVSHGDQVYTVIGLYHRKTKGLVTKRGPGQ